MYEKMTKEELQREREDIQKELGDIRRLRLENMKKTADLISELNSTISRLIEKHPAYTAISKMEKMRDELLSAYENYETLLRITDGL